jgi:hypothetical protein
MAIIFDTVTAEIAPPAPTTSANESASAPNAGRVDAQAVLRELQRISERAERLKAD